MVLSVLLHPSARLVGSCSVAHRGDMGLGGVVQGPPAGAGCEQEVGSVKPRGGLAGC